MTMRDWQNLDDLLELCFPTGAELSPEESRAVGCVRARIHREMDAGIEAVRRSFRGDIVMK